MEPLIVFVGRSLGISLGIAAVSALKGGVRPILRQVLKAGIVMNETAQSATSGARQTVSSAMDEARHDVNDARTEAMAERNAGRAMRQRNDAEPRKIVIVKE